MARPTVNLPEQDTYSLIQNGSHVAVMDLLFLVELNDLQGIFLHTFSQDPTIEELEKSGWLVQHNSEPHTLLDDCFYVSGAIPRQTDFENGQPGHMR